MHGIRPRRAVLVRRPVREGEQGGGARARRGVNEAEPVDVNAVEVRLIGTCKSTRVRHSGTAYTSDDIITEACS
jgi:hypothetical protein